MAKPTRVSLTVLASMLVLTSAPLAAAQTRSSGAEYSRKAKSNEFARYDARTFYETIAIFGSSFSADEQKLLYTSDASGVFNVYSQPVGGGEPTALTTSTTNAVMGIGWFPKDDRLLYTSDVGGNELNHIYVREMDGTIRDLTPGDNLKASFAGWAEDDKAFFVTTNERDPRYFDLYRYSIDGYDRQLVFENPGGYSVDGISRDERWIALLKVRNNADNNIYVVDMTSDDKTPRLVTEHEGNVSYGTQDFSPDNSSLYYTSDEGGEFQRLWAMSLATGDKQVVEIADWDIRYSGFSRNGRYRVTSINDDARTRIIVRDGSGREIKMPHIPQGDVTGVNISRSGRHMAFYVNGSRSPSNLFVLDMESGRHRRLTTSLNPKINEANLVEAKVVRYPSFDGIEVPAILYKPIPASSSKPVPALVWVHGGPGGQSRVGYSAAIQFLANHGFAVLAVNNRGSSGYGKTFFHLDDQRHGEDDLQDCIWGRKYLENLGWVKGDQVGIIGGSYGGYMVAAALAFQPDAFEVGIDIFGVTNWLRTLESIPSWWTDFREALYAELGDPEKDRDRLHRISPLFHADKITKPLLVVQGANDPRVLREESDELVAAVQKNGVPVEYVIFDDEGHGFRSRENRITAANSYLDFLERYLKQRSD